MLVARSRRMWLTTIIDISVKFYNGSIAVYKYNLVPDNQSPGSVTFKVAVADILCHKEVLKLE